MAKKTEIRLDWDWIEDFYQGEQVYEKLLIARVTDVFLSKKWWDSVQAKEKWRRYYIREWNAKLPKGGRRRLPIGKSPLFVCTNVEDEEVVEEMEESAGRFAFVQHLYLYHAPWSLFA